ncbi:enoyl-CoA hydratase/isomerase family protein [Aspergillus clavatus NRRL 1]|uniref:Enoyl-CoA hydratase/isomerase family protein n=1 Tax=Aspergillus clavatus (strain ATCC 1007 / CBS 513.65 / DSM 816 / NCTC 3887 / NRRL 1 / QM 1276 / 107) TaxID=344612 RepID=A1C8U5_ASPCL|nr:enoyl-CoA hydratase/isomerase family protein [Aspergillus clavatus NRRL 1]EAW13732.1 enoyl-CoA hydratase/isomerase family protein [Aspergillus clavatus NRRL 1]
MKHNTTSSDLVLVETYPFGARVLALNRPAKRNALSQTLINSLLAELENASTDPQIQSIIITGSQTIFSAGADIKEIAELDGETARQQRYLENLCHGMRNIRKPIIAAIEGKALGGGFELALMADCIVATPEVEFRLPEISIGLIPGAGGTQRLTAAIGKYRAMNMILLNQPISGQEAYQLGLASKLVESGKALSGALEMAEQLGSKSPSTILLAKEAICRADELQHDHEFERSLYYTAFGTGDMMEGVSAFLEKRAPVWKNGRNIASPTMDQ